jgi:two-component system, chemotaxis family, sensor kinase CheA
MEEEIKSSEELLKEFIEEADKRLIKIRSDFKTFREKPDNKEIIHLLFRGFHNLKSSSYSLQLPNIRRIAHLSEDILGLLRDDNIRLDENISALLSESIDYLDETLINLYESGFEGRRSPVGLILKLKEFIDSQIKKSIPTT